MEWDKGLRLFISYSHKDNQDDCPHVQKFVDHLAPLKGNGLISDIWYDHRILAGENLEDRVGESLENADVVCLLISSNSLSSDSCKGEKREAFALWKKKRIAVIPIILSPCGWQDDKDILENHVLALPADGKPVSKFCDEDTAWQDVYDGLKRVLEREASIRQLRIRREHEDFLQSVEMLTKAHPQKDTLSLNDIFVHPDLVKYSNLREDKGTVSSRDLLENISDYSRIVIAGAEQSGKTTLCKKIFEELRGRNFIPVYVSDTTTRFEGKMENRIREALGRQYEGVEAAGVYDDYKDRIVPIVDDFYLAKDKKRHIQDLSVYPINVLVVDDVFGLNIADQNLTNSFSYFKIRELRPTLRCDLIKKWVSVSGGDVGDDYKDVDERTALIDATLGKTLGKGIMPAYPFFILSVILAYETTAKPLDQEITSQGYCYQAFIYFYLRKQGVRNDEIDTYLNFLTELAYNLCKNKTHELSPDDFDSFMQSYLARFNLPIEPKVLLGNLCLLVTQDTLGSWLFRYRYVYYFFVAKYLAEHSRDLDAKEETVRVLSNLHVNENAYIAVFIAHHSRDVTILNTIKTNASHLFEKYPSATLSRDEVRFLDSQADLVVEAALPPSSSIPEKEREKKLQREDEAEESRESVEEGEDSADSNPLERELRKAIKTVEVMGSIMRNRAGSLEKAELEEMFEVAMSVHLRILSSYFDLIREADDQEAFIGYISERLMELNEELGQHQDQPMTEGELREKAKVIFWNLNFFVVYGWISMIVRSLGSDKLIPISNNVCDGLDTPASFLVKHGNLMSFAKNVRVDEIAKKTQEPGFSRVATRVIDETVISYCYLHQVGYKEIQRIGSVLNIKTSVLAIH